MMISDAELLNWVGQLLWPLFRISAMFMVMAGIGAKSVSPRIRLMLSVAVTMAVFPVLPPGPMVDPFTGQGFLITAQQLVIGIFIGLMSQMVMQTFILAGQMIAMQTGLGFASVVDPGAGQQVPVIGQFYLILGTLLFFGLDGHLMMVRMTIASFEALPIGVGGFSALDFRAFAHWGSWLYSAALTMSLSALTALLVINFSFGMITRAAPQLNIFAIGFPITMLSGLLVLWLLLGDFTTHFEGQWQRGIDLICSRLGGVCYGR